MFRTFLHDSFFKRTFDTWLWFFFSTLKFFLSLLFFSYLNCSQLNDSRRNEGKTLQVFRARKSLTKTQSSPVRFTGSTWILFGWFQGANETISQCVHGERWKTTENTYVAVHIRVRKTNKFNFSRWVSPFTTKLAIIGSIFRNLNWHLSVLTLTFDQIQAKN